MCALNTFMKYAFEQEFKQQVTDSMHKEGITALLSPGMSCPAVPVGIPGKVGSK